LKIENIYKNNISIYIFFLLNKMRIELSKQFEKGLYDYGLTMEDMKKFYYCGGNIGCHHNYFIKSCPNDDLPDLVDRCVCNHLIRENCYVTDGERILIVGNCCIKRFLPKENSGRTCEICRQPHRNRKDNKCNNCRKGKGMCIICKKSTFKPAYKYCLDCYYQK